MNNRNNIHFMNARHPNTGGEMRNAETTSFVGSLHVAVVLVALMAFAKIGYASGQPAPAKSESVIPKSVFVNDPEVGKDPFFPYSTRRKDAMPRAVVTAPSTNATPALRIHVDLKLKGIAGTKEQRLALINSVTMAQGETADIKCAGGHIIKVRCREIRDYSVLVELVGLGEVRELKLREGV
jgi:hypothetical protein